MLADLAVLRIYHRQ